MRRRPDRTALALALAAGWLLPVGGCSTAERGTPEQASSTAEPAPAPAPEMKRPAIEKQPAVLGSVAPSPPAKQRSVEVTADKVAKGKALFGTCVGCHGEKAEGRIGIGPRIASDSYLAAASDEFLITTIKKGRAGTTMIPWGAALKDEQIESIVAYLRSLHPVEPAELNDAAAQGEADKGEGVFRDICSGCHGRFGAGYMETANGTGIGRKAFLDAAPDGFIRHVVKHGKTLTKMRGFDEKIPTAIANLSDEEVDDTIAYLRKNAW